MTDDTAGLARRKIAAFVAVFALVLGAGLAAKAAVARDLRVAVVPEAGVGPAFRLYQAPADVPVWKTIALGTRHDIIKLREALYTPPFALGDLASEMLGQAKFAVSVTPTEINLVALSVSELGFGEAGAPLSDIYARAAQLGFALCPAEAGPQLRLQYLDQPIGEFLSLAMDPIGTYDGKLAGFSVGNAGTGLLLVGGDARPNLMVPRTARFLFVRPVDVETNVESIRLQSRQ